MGTFKFISEKPLKSELQFGHKQILEALKFIVTKCTTPFTIGLYGKWGSGKSSISESLQEALVDSGIPVILFDVWKHEGDALRRTFLKEIVRQLHNHPYGHNFFDRDFKLSERIDSAHEQKQQKQIKLDWKSFKSILQLSAIISVIPVIVFIATGYFVMKEAPWLSSAFQNLMASILSISTLGLFVKWIFESAKDFTSKSEITISHDKLTDPHDFEDEFRRILKHLSNSRVVIVFDNLDRVSGESALSIISTIKTFLEPIDRSIESKEVVFLVPCDVSAIKNHLQKVMRGEAGHLSSKSPDTDAYADEFLRKFFNTILWIPEFYSIELEQFAHEKLKETGIKEFDNNQLSWLMIKIFRENPRQIIQFINILISNYLVLKEKSVKGAFGGDTKFFEKNIPQLAKYLLLIQRFPSVLELYKINKIYNLDEDVFEGDTTLKKEFDNFRKETSDIAIASLEPFFNFKISEQEQQIPGVDRVLHLMDNNEVGNAVEAAKNLNLPERSRQFGAIIQNYLGAKRNTVIIFNFLNSLFHITKILQITLDQNAYRDIKRFVEKTDLSGLERVDAELFGSEFLDTNKSKIAVKDFTQIIVRGWALILKNQTGMTKTLLQKVFRETLIRLEFLDDSGINNIQTATNQFVDDSDLLSILLEQDSEIQKRVITNVFISNLFAALKLVQNNTDSERQLSQRAKEIEKIDKDARDQIQPNTVISKISELLQVELNNTTDVRLKQSVIEAIRKIINAYPDKLQAQPSSTENLASVVTSSYQTGRWTSCHLMVPMILDLEHLNTEPLSSRMRGLRVEFFTNLGNIPSSGVIYVFDTIQDGCAHFENPDYKAQIDSFIGSSLELFRTIYGYAKDDTKYRWIHKLITEGKAAWISNSADIIASGIPSRPSLSVVLINRMVEVTENVEWIKACELLEALKLNRAEINVQNFKNLFVAKLQSPDQSLQRAGKTYFETTTYLLDEDKSSIVSVLIDWLIEAQNPYQPIVLEAISSRFIYLANDSKKKFIAFLLQRVILNSENAQWIEGATNLLSGVGFTLGDHLETLKNIKEKATSLKISNPSLSLSLANAFKKITQNSEEKSLEKLRDEMSVEFP